MLPAVVALASAVPAWAERPAASPISQAPGAAAAPATPAALRIPLPAPAPLVP